MSRFFRRQRYSLPAIFLAAFLFQGVFLYAATPPPGETAGAEISRFREEAEKAEQRRREAVKEEPPVIQTESETTVGDSFVIEKKTPMGGEFAGLEGIVLLNKLDREKKDAAEKLDFEQAIVLRDKMGELKKTREYAEIAEVWQKMQEASVREDYEQAIVYREEVFKLQKQIEAPKPEPKFMVRVVRISGNNVVTTQELEPFIAPLINREVKLSELQNAARDIKNHYRGEGYVAAFAYVPAQTVKDGVVDIRIIEGTLGSFVVEGARWFSNELIKDKIKLVPGEVIRYDNLRDSVDEINKHRDIDTKVVLRPGAQAMTTDVLVQVEDRFPVHLSVDMNNYGTRLTGEERFGVTLAHTNVFGMFDEATVRVQAGEGAYAVGADYNIPVTPYDTRLGFAFSYGETDLTGDFKALNVEGDATIYSPYIKQPLFKEDVWGMKLAGEAKFSYDHKIIDNRLLDVPSGRDDVRLASPGITFEETDKYGKTIWPHSVHFGLTEFGGTHKNDEALIRAQTGAPFTIYRSSIDRYTYLPHGMMLLLHGSLQLADDKLPPSEQFQLGGVNSVRGYPQGEFLGDYGATATVEFLVPPLFFPEHWKFPTSKYKFRDQFKFVGFFDYGTADLKGPLPGEVRGKDIAGAGVGVRFKLYDSMFGRIEYALPLQEKTSDGSDGTVYFGFSMDLI